MGVVSSAIKRTLEMLLTETIGPQRPRDRRAPA